MRDYKLVAIEAAKAGGRILKRRFDGQLHVRSKGANDVVSDADIGSEKAIIGTIRRYFPQHAMRAEESGRSSKRSDYLWVIDPLDGTFNFLIGNPYFSVSIALAYRNEIVLGVVFNPILNQLYYAEKGRGAYLNGKRIRVSGKKNLGDSFVAMGFLYFPKDINRHLAVVKNFVLNTKKAFDIASPALNLCNVARGKIDGFVDYGTTPEDHAAGSIILSEAGGRVENYRKRGFDFRKAGVVASNGLLHSSILRTIG